MDKKPKSDGRSIYDNPQFFPSRDRNNKGFDPRASLGERANAQQTKAPSATISSEETLFNTVNVALIKYSDTIKSGDLVEPRGSLTNFHRYLENIAIIPMFYWDI